MNISLTIGGLGCEDLDKNVNAVFVFVTGEPMRPRNIIASDTPHID